MRELVSVPRHFFIYHISIAGAVPLIPLMLIRSIWWAERCMATYL
jgi:hypothetical protein